MSRKLQIFIAIVTLTAGLSTAAIAVAVQTATAAAPASGSGPEPLEEVIVNAKRAQLVPRVSKFVARIAARENEEGLPRWLDPVCPLVSGLPRDEGEFMLGRISEIATAARVPLAGEHCRPNLFIVVTTQPRELLQAMEKKDRAVTFGGANPTTVDAFIATPRPVRVWYDTDMRTPEGIPPSPGAGTALILGGGLGGMRVFNDIDRTSHILLSKIWALSYVFVVVDQSRLQDVSRGQFADYVAMVGLADIKPDGGLGDADTILRLFEGPPRSAAAGLSVWDQAFLKTLYASDQRTRTQTNAIANGIVREVLHK